jgi:5-(carboxyamino)imidazole ribonucleotide mutase
MPAGVPVATMAIGRAGAINAALLAVAILGAGRPALRKALRAWREERAKVIKDEVLTLDEDADER